MVSENRFKNLKKQADLLFSLVLKGHVNKNLIHLVTQSLYVRIVLVKKLFATGHEYLVVFYFKME